MSSFGEELCLIAESAHKNNRDAAGAEAKVIENKVRSVIDKEELMNLAKSGQYMKCYTIKHKLPAGYSDAVLVKHRYYEIANYSDLGLHREGISQEWFGRMIACVSWANHSMNSGHTRK